MCDTCHQHHEQITERLERMREEHAAMRRDLEVHIAETHAHVSQQTIQQWDQDIINALSHLTTQHEKLATAVMGPMSEDFDGELHREASEGMAHQLNTVETLASVNSKGITEIKRTLGNGGIHTRLVLSDKVLVAVIAALAAIASAYFGG